MHTPPPITDPHQALAHLALGDRSRFVAFSALPHAPVLPIRDPRFARFRQLAARATPRMAQRPVRTARTPTAAAGCG